MTENSPTPAKHPIGLRRMVLPGALVAVAAAVAVLYVIGAPGSKVVQASQTCAATQAVAERLASLVHGEVAALNLSKQPKPVPDLVFDGPDGTKLTLASFKGRNVLLNLWATWCVPCRQEMPALDHLQATLGSESFTVVAINIDTARLDRPKAFLNEVGVKNLAFYADNKADVFQVLKRDGKVVGLPTTILIGKDGCDIGTLAGPAQWDSQEAQALIAAAQS